MTLLDAAAENAKKLASLLGDVTRDRNDYNEIKRLRDQAFTHLKEAVDEIYGFGQFVFWHDDDRLRGYRSNYFRQLRLRKTSKKQGTTPASTAVPATRATTSAAA